jgi:cell division protein FtsQ
VTDTPPPAAPSAATPASGAAAGTAGPSGAAAPAAGGQAGAGPGGTGPGGARRPPGAARGRARRRRTRWRAAFFALAGLALVAGVGWALLGDRVFVVRSVTVTGTHLLAPVQVIAAADVPPGTPLLSVDAGSVTRRVEAIPQVASATVTEDWPDHLLIAVTERVPALAVRMAGGGYDLVDPSGVLVRWAKALPTGIPVFVTAVPGGALRGNPELTTAAGVLAELQPWLARQVAQLSAAAAPAGPQQVTLNLRDGKTVQWGSTDNAAQKNRELSVVLPGQARHVDVSAPGTVVTR